MKKLWQDDTWEDYVAWQARTAVWNLAGFWSVRIDEKNRIVFRISDNKLEIAECGSHYGDH
ncbi:MAG: type II toxin-antitoxin system YoeB family toxin [Erysipelotrichaceae bacterium]|nr:type II toxin-antitoxin system YoeB family toxin [Erysipelotrichaceae bacterium]